MILALTPPETVVFVGLGMLAMVLILICLIALLHFAKVAVWSYSESRLLGSSVMGNILKKLFGTRCDFEGCRTRLSEAEGIRWQGIAYCNREHADMAVATSASPELAR